MQQMNAPTSTNYKVPQSVTAAADSIVEMSNAILCSNSRFVPSGAIGVQELLSLIVTMLSSGRP